MQPPAKPFGIPDDFEEHLKTLFDLQVLAVAGGDDARFHADAGSGRPAMPCIPKSGVRDAFHPLSHHSNVQENKDKLAQINRYHISLFGYLLEKMRKTPDGAGTLLDNSILMWGSGMGDSNVHNHDPLPILLAGGGAGRLKGGRHISAGSRGASGKKTPLSTLHLALLQKAGVEMETFGDSSGTVDIRQCGLWVDERC